MGRKRLARWGVFKGKLNGENACGGIAPFRIVTSFKIITSASESTRLPIKPDKPQAIREKVGIGRRHYQLFLRTNLEN